MEAIELMTEMSYEEFEALLVEAFGEGDGAMTFTMGSLFAGIGGFDLGLSVRDSDALAGRD